MNTSDRVVCVDAKKRKSKIPPLIEGRDYIIYGVLVCNCGRKAFDVGFSCEKKIRKCDTCGAIHETDILYAGAFRFRKVEEKREYKVVKSNIEIEQEIEEVLGDIKEIEKSLG